MPGRATSIPTYQRIKTKHTHSMRTRLAFLPAVGLLLLAQPLHADSLTDVYALAQQHSPQLQAASAASVASAQRKRQALAQFLPQARFGANLSAAWQQTGSLSQNVNSSGYSLNLTQPVYYQERFHQYAQADSRLAQSEAELEAARRELLLTVAERYFEVLAAIDNREFTSAEKQAIGRQMEQTKQRFDVGLIAITDVHEAQAAFDLAVAQEIEAENLLASAREGLRELTGQYHNNLSALTDNVPLVSPEPADIQKWIDTALRQNYRLQAVQYGVDAAREEIRSQRAGHFPTVDVVAGHDYSAEGGLRIGAGDGSFTNTSISLQLNLPLYSGGATVARTKEAEALYDQASASLEEQRRAIQRRTSESYLKIFTTISRVKALKQALTSTQSALTASEAGLEVGTRTTVDVLNTRRDLFRARRDHARARYDYVLNTLRLKEAAGQLALAELQQVNAWLK